MLATDHSSYANSCINEFLRICPKGIGRLVLVTVCSGKAANSIGSIAQDFKADFEGFIRSVLVDPHQEVIARLKKIGAEISSRVEVGSVSESIAHVMKEEQAELLVLGAQGHGFVERITLGSVSMDQVVRRPYSVLIVRV